MSIVYIIVTLHETTAVFGFHRGMSPPNKVSGQSGEDSPSRKNSNSPVNAVSRRFHLDLSKRVPFYSSPFHCFCIPRISGRNSCDLSTSQFKKCSATSCVRWRTHRSAMLAVKDEDVQHRNHAETNGSELRFQLYIYFPYTFYFFVTSFLLTVRAIWIFI